MSRDGMNTVVAIVAAVLAVVGLTVVAFFVFVAAAMNNYGSNK